MKRTLQKKLVILGMAAVLQAVIFPGNLRAEEMQEAVIEEIGIAEPDYFSESAPENQPQESMPQSQESTAGNPAGEIIIEDASVIPEKSDENEASTEASAEDSDTAGGQEEETKDGEAEKTDREQLAVSVQEVDENEAPERDREQELEALGLEQEISVITGFGPLPENQREYMLSGAGKPSEKEMIAKMPDTLQVYLKGKKKPVTIPVEWGCVGDDYEKSTNWYFQFSPVWDLEKYQLSDQIDYYTEAPYIAVYYIPASGISLSQAAQTENAAIIFDFLTEKMGFNTAAAYGILSNILHESGFNPNAAGDGSAAGPTSYGICQWHNGRWTSLDHWCSQHGYDSNTLMGQLYYLKAELTEGILYNGSQVFQYMKSVPNNADGAYQAAYYWCYYYEIPNDKEYTSMIRGNLARDSYRKEGGNLFPNGSSAVFEENGPLISEITIDKEESSYTISCCITDENEVSEIRFLTWTDQRKEGTLLQEEAGTIEQAEDGRVVFTINTEDISEKAEGFYITRILAKDSLGNTSCKPVGVMLGEPYQQLGEVQQGEKEYVLTANLYQVSWENLQIYCEWVLKGQLACPDDPESREAAGTLLQEAKEQDAWVGGRKEKEADQWKWLDHTWICSSVMEMEEKSEEKSEENNETQEEKVLLIDQDGMLFSESARIPAAFLAEIQKNGES